MKKKTATGWTKLVAYRKHVKGIRLVGVTRRRNLESIMQRAKEVNSEYRKVLGEISQLFVMLFCLFKAWQKKEKKKKTISVFHGVEHYQQTEKKRLRLKMLIAVACCKKYYLKNNTQNRFNLSYISFLWFCLLEAQN